MTDLQTRLREVLRAEAGRAQPDLLRELRLPPRRRGRRRLRRPGAAGPGRGSRLLPWLAPLAAALAVVAVISAVRLSVADPAGDVPATNPDVSPAAISPAAASPAAPIPSLWVSAARHGQARVWVNNSVTGQVISKVGVAKQLPIAISAAADDRTFVVVFQDLYNEVITTFTRLALTASGKPASFTRLPLRLPANGSLQTTGGMALSPDGQTLALALNIGQSQAAIRKDPKLAQVETGEIELVSLRTGATRTWVVPSGQAVTDLSWARGDQTLAFLASGPGGLPNDDLTQVRVLDVSRPAGALLAASTPVRLATAGGRIQSMQVTDGGSMVVGWTRMPSRAKVQGRGTLVLTEYSVRTGRQLRIFSRLPTVSGNVGYGLVYSADPSGQHVLIYLNTSVARVDNGRVTRLASPDDFGAW
jgi:hypothetical protein